MPDRTRRRHSPADREAALFEAQGLCHLCGLSIAPGQRWEMSHVGVPHAHGGDDVAPAHFRCHQIETSTVTAPLVAKTRRQRRVHIGVTSPGATLPCSRRSRWRKKLSGGAEPRVAGFARDRLLRETMPGLDFTAPPLMRQVQDTKP